MRNISTEVLEEVDSIQDQIPLISLTLHNDDFNTFEHVIACLHIICEHTIEQAEQCAYLVHYKGKCIIKHGEFEHIFNLYKKLLSEGLTVTFDYD